jgi:spermidine/putrescine-binding protein
MAGMRRRRFLQTTGASALAAGSGGLAAILASGRAPAFAQATTLHWLRLGDFVPASDALMSKELLPEAEKALGIKIKFETINGNDLQARITWPTSATSPRRSPRTRVASTTSTARSRRTSAAGWRCHGVRSVSC